MNRPYHHGALREALLAAAEVILERDGVEALTLRGAAREAGVTHGSPAHHFGDLQGLLSELAASGFIRFHERLRAEAADAGPQFTRPHCRALPRLCQVRARQPWAVPTHVSLRAGWTGRARHWRPQAPERSRC